MSRYLHRHGELPLPNTQPCPVWMLARYVTLRGGGGIGVPSPPNSTPFAEIRPSPPSRPYGCHGIQEIDKAAGLQLDGFVHGRSDCRGGGSRGNTMKEHR